ncbi:hypothetical protein AB205_0115080 [Aquarana catesbeiana]|uniref:Uncharacterized protein n=1 Tax=Aquarana catesbeiana TaxID=8400 RepID=A0A2G9RHP1_AQUCT|nr:hypothetical protein AB205_0115080 [Aquarana catesbeiana]
MKLDLPQSNKSAQHYCSIQVTSENGALCIINPLFLHEHGDNWLTHNSQTQEKEKRKSVLWRIEQEHRDIRIGPALEELDSVSISSVEEDGEGNSLRPKRHQSHGLGDIVRHSLLAVSTALTGLVSPEKHLGNRIKQLSEDTSSYLGETFQTFMVQLQKRSVVYHSSTEMLQAIRQLLTNLMNYLLESNETLEILDRQEIEEFKIGLHDRAIVS